MPPFRPTPRLARSIPELFSSIRAQRHPQVVHVQVVRFQKPFTWRTFTLGAFMGWLALNIYDDVVIGPLARASERAAQSLSQEELDELDNSPIFIPFPFTEREVKLPPYSGNDPEWRKFIEINNDGALLKTIQQDLANICVNAVKKTPGLVHQMGPDITLEHYWLSIQYPMGPPPELRRGGIEISDDGFAWVEKKVELSTIQRVRRILWPTPLAMSMWHFSWALVKQNLQDAARSFGLSSSPSEPAAERAIAEAVQTMVRTQDSKHRPPTVSGPGRMPPATRQTENGPVTDNPNKPAPLSAREKSSSAPTVPPKSGTSGEDEDEKNKLRPQDLYPYETLRGRMKGAWEEFFKSWNMRWLKVRNHPPSGVVVVTGLVQVNGRNATAIIDCVGCWDPKTRDYVQDNLWLRMRSFKPVSQSPLR